MEKDVLAHARDQLCFSVLSEHFRISFAWLSQCFAMCSISLLDKAFCEKRIRHEHGFES